MISNRAGEAASSSFSSRFPYDVFLSFRGLDTRKTFTGHLYTALHQAGFRTFLDNKELEYGKDIKIELKKAITESKISLVVLSENYASSRWCLNELVKILQRKNAGGHSVVPIFYHVKPRDVRCLSGNFGEAFERQRGKLKERKEDTRKLQEWKVALQKVADFRGMDLEEDANGIESNFIQQIVQHVREEVGHKMLAIDSYLVGINDRARDIESWLQDEATDIHIMIICGLGGIGKTTIAKFLYNRNFLKFQGSSFLENVRETLRESRGLHHLQEQLFSDILKDRRKIVHNNSEAIFELQNGLRCKKVLIIFDAVDEQDQLDKILGERNWLLQGSKIIITARNKSLLSPLEVHKVTRIEALSPNESLQLFSWHAFGKTHPTTRFNDVSQFVVNYCGGNPLAIKVLASLLRQHGNHLDKWSDELSKLIESPNDSIVTVLRTSYDSLGRHEKNLFLHIACLFVGKNTDKVIMTLNLIGFHAKAGIDILMNRCMLEAHSRLKMHQLLQEMGRQIVCQESSNELGQRCILWNHYDSFNVLREKSGTGNIKSIVLDGSQLNHSYALTAGYPNKEILSGELLECLSKLSNSHSEDTAATTLGNLNLVLETDAFAKMHNLNFLKLKWVQLHGSYENFPKRLRYVKWCGSLLQSIPSNFAMERLVVLDMKHSSLKYLWDGSKNLSSLEILNVRDSHSLRETPNFSLVRKLKQLILENCTSLVELHESIGKLKDLILLNLKNCKNLSKLPESIGMLNSLDTLDVSGCSRLEGLPRERENLKNLQVLCGNEIGEVEAQKWKASTCEWKLNPQKIPKITLASFPQSLTDLSLQGCNLVDEDFPSKLSILFSLEYLNLSNNMISKTPDFIKYLQKLKSLSLESCLELQYSIVTNVEFLYVNNCVALKRITSTCDNPDTLVEHNGCGDLAEVEGAFKLEPIEDVDAEILNNLGLCNLRALQFTNVKLRKRWEKNARKFPLQVYSAVGIFNNLTRCFQTNKYFEADSDGTSIFNGINLRDQKGSWNIFSTWVPRSKVSCWFNYHAKAKSAFTMPSHKNTTITQGLTVRIEYEKREYSPRPNHLEHLTSRNYLGVLNNSKGLRWEVFYEVMGIPETNEDMTWLTFFRMASHHVEVGDELSVVVYPSHEFKVKEIGVRLLYKEHEQQPSLSTIEQSRTFAMYSPNNVDAYLRSGQNGQEYDGCGDLADVKSAFKLEPFVNVDEKILRNLDLYKWRTLQFTNVKLQRCGSKEARKVPLQVYCTMAICDNFIEQFQTRKFHSTKSDVTTVFHLYLQERGWNIFSTWVPRKRTVSYWVKYRQKAKLAFTVPSHEDTRIIQGLSVRILYQVHNANYSERLTTCCGLMVCNRSKGLKWDVFYDVMGIPETNEVMTWSTFFKMAIHHVEGGDELFVVANCCTGFNINEIDVRLFYEEYEQGPTLLALACRHTFVKEIPFHLDEYLRSGQSGQGKLKLNASGNSIRKAFGGLITFENRKWVIGYYGNLEKPYWDVSKLEAELEGIYNGLCLIKDKTCFGVEIVTHSLDVFALINDDNSLHESNTLPHRFSDTAHLIAHDILEKFEHLYSVEYTSIERTGVKVAAKLVNMHNPGEPFVILEKPPMAILKFCAGECNWIIL